MTTLINNSSSNEQIKIYFQKIFQLSQTGERFPVNLDEVWPLVYSEKRSALLSLKNDCIEDEDYMFAWGNYEANSEKKNRGGHNRINCYMSVSCFEFFIAKKVKPVFEVYRQVFHQAIQKAQPLLNINPIMIDSRPYYDYVEVLRKRGYSTGSGCVYARKRKYPQEFRSLDGRLMITDSFVNYLVSSSSLRNLQLEMRENHKLYMEEIQRKQLSLFCEMQSEN